MELNKGINKPVFTIHSINKNTMTRQTPNSFYTLLYHTFCNHSVFYLSDGLFDRSSSDEEGDDGGHYHNRQRRVAWHDQKWPKTGEYVYIPYTLSNFYFSSKLLLFFMFRQMLVLTLTL